MESSFDSDLKPLDTMWWLTILLGVISVGVGIFFITSPHETLTTFTVIAGVFLLIDGALAILASIFGNGEGRGLLATLGVLSIIAGLILVKHPFNALIAFILILGVWLVASGVIRLIVGFSDSEGRAGNFAMAFIDLVAGIAVLAWPNPSLATLAVIIGIVLTIRGIAAIFAGFELHGAIKDFKSEALEA